MAGGYAGMGEAARRQVESEFNWRHTLPPVKALLEAV
jgi:hypothetical protein